MLSHGVGALAGGDLSQSLETRVLAPVVPLLETAYYFSDILNWIVMIQQTPIWSLFCSSIIYVIENTKFIPFRIAMETSRLFIYCTLSYFFL